MKKIYLLLAFFALMACESDDNSVQKFSAIQLNFTHNWDGTNVTFSDFNTIQYINANGEELSIERLRYLISDVIFTRDTGEIIEMDGYNLVNVTDNQGLSYVIPNEFAEGTYSMSFTFGMDNEDNIDGAYQDLNSASFNVPMMLGGGYHFMQFDGK